MSSAQVHWMIQGAGETPEALCAPGERSAERSSFIRQAGQGVRDALAWLASVGAPGNLHVSAEMGRVVTDLLDSGYSFRRLAAHPGVTSSATLFRAVRIFQLGQVVGGFESFRHVGVGHASCVLTLPSHVQQRLLLAAEQERWSRARLRSEAQQARVAAE